MDRFYGYNRHDYHFPRSCREAFGSDFDVVTKKSMSEVLLISIYIILLAIFASLLS